MDIVKKASVLNKWFDRDPSDNKYLFLMVIIAIAIIIPPLAGFLVIASSQSTKISAETGSLASPTPVSSVCGSQCTNLAVDWTRPSAVAQFVDTKGKIVTCTSTALTCTATGVFTPNSVINYTVNVKTASGAILKTGTAIVTPKKQATANWNWTYAVAVYPSTYRDCLSAGVYNECLTKVVANDNVNNSVTFGNVKYDTEYSIFVCSPNCGTGTVVLQTKQKTAALPGPTSCTISPTSILSPGSFYLTASGYTSGSYPVRMVDGFGGSVFNESIGNLTYPVQAFTIRSGISSGTYAIRITTTSGTFIQCTPGLNIFNPSPAPTPIASCTYDYNKDGKIDTADVEILLTHFGEAAPAGSNLSIYDLDGSQSITLADALILQNKFGSCQTQ